MSSSFSLFLFYSLGRPAGSFPAGRPGIFVEISQNAGRRPAEISRAGGFTRAAPILYNRDNIQIEARYPSVPPRKARQPRGRKGATAEVPGECLLPRRWVGREDLPDCHKFFVKRYRWKHRHGAVPRCFAIPRNAFKKAFRFFDAFRIERLDRRPVP